MTAYNGLHNKDDIIGQHFNKWTVLEYSHKNERSGNWYYICKCDCGNLGTVKASNLRNGGSKQCKVCSSKENGRKGLYAQNEGTDLYLIRCGLYVKIGTTKDLTERMRTMQSNNPLHLELEYYGVGKGYQESYWHTYFEHKHHKGEWYMLSSEEVNEIKTSKRCEI
jgi:hypothetical protein